MRLFVIIIAGDLIERMNFYIMKRSLLFVLILIILAGLLMMGLSGCFITSPAASAGTSNFDINKKTLVIGSDTSYPPFEYVTNGETIGFDVDIIKEIATRLGKNIEIKPISWDPEFKELADGKIDMIISAVSLSGNQAVVDYSNSYYTLEYLMITLNGSETKTRDSLQQQNIGVLETGKDNISSQYLQNYKINTYQDIMEMLQALRDKEIEAILVPIPIGVTLIRDNKDIYSVIDKTTTDKNFVMVFNKGSILKDKINEAIDEIKKDGTYQEIYDKWFNYNS